MADFLFVDNRINRSSIQSIIQIGQASELYFQRLHTNCTRVGKAIKRKPHGYGFQPIPTRFFCGGDEGIEPLPLACEASALPSELHPPYELVCKRSAFAKFIIAPLTAFVNINF